MKPTSSILALILLVALAPACLVRTTTVRGSCPPAHHWENGYCVHNGRARGHDRHHDDDRHHDEHRGRGHGHHD